MRRFTGKIVLSLFVHFCLFSLALDAQSDNCNLLTCDGITCDDGTPADGVMTSSKCGCGQDISGACAQVLIDLSENASFDRSKDGGFVLTTQENGNFIGFITDDTYQVNSCSEPDFNVINGNTWKIPVDSITHQLADKFYMVICKSSGNAGRRDFSIAYFPVNDTEAEACDDGFDNDLDGLIDCDDPDCHKSCDYSSTKSSAEGGLESHNDLGYKIAHVRFNARTSQLSNSSIWKEPTVLRARSVHSRVNNDLMAFTEMSSFDEAKAVESSPTYLTDITNADDLKAWDFYIGQERIAAILAIYSEKGVYEHAKSMCDRLSGAEIVDILKWPVDDRHSFLITKFLSANGSVEYAMTFSVSKDDQGHMQLESYWNLSSYSPDRSHYTFQLWANNMYHLSKIFQTVKSNIEGLYPIVSYHIGDAPGIFINHVDFTRNGELQLHYTNKKGLKTASFSGGYSSTEHTSERPYDYVHHLSDRIVDSLVLPSELFYDMGITIKGDSVEDAIFFADGRWDVSYNQSVDHLESFDVLPAIESNTEGYTVRRSVNIGGSVKNYINLYRSLKADFTAENLDDFNVLSFRASGQGRLEIAMVRASEKDWSKQGKYYIDLQPEEKEYVISKNDLADSYGAITSWKDPYMIVFTIIGNGFTYQDFALSLSEVQFSDYSLGPQILVRNSDQEVLRNKTLSFNMSAEYEGQRVPLDMIFENLSQDTIGLISVSSASITLSPETNSNSLISLLPHANNTVKIWIPAEMVPSELMIPVTIETNANGVIELMVQVSVECVGQQNILITDPVRSQTTYKAIESISSSSIINEGSITFKAGESMMLMPGFEVQHSAELSLEISDDCLIRR